MNDIFCNNSFEYYAKILKLKLNLFTFPGFQEKTLYTKYTVYLRKMYAKGFLPLKQFIVQTNFFREQNKE